MEKLNGYNLIEELGSELFITDNDDIIVRKYKLKLLSSIKAKYVLLSYSSDGLISKDEIISLFKKAGLYGIKLYEFQYRRFKSNKNTQKDLVKEYIFVGRK